MGAASWDWRIFPSFSYNIINWNRLLRSVDCFSTYSLFIHTNWRIWYIIISMIIYKWILIHIYSSFHLFQKYILLIQTENGRFWKLNPLAHESSSFTMFGRSYAFRITGVQWNIMQDSSTGVFYWVDTRIIILFLLLSWLILYHTYITVFIKYIHITLHCVRYCQLS